MNRSGSSLRPRPRSRAELLKWLAPTCVLLFASLALVELVSHPLWAAEPQNSDADASSSTPSSASETVTSDDTPTATRPPAEGRKDAFERRAPGAERQRIGGPRVEIFGQPVELQADQWLDGSVVVIGGSATINGDVSQHVVTIFGSVDLNGDVEGNVVSVLGRTTLGPTEIDGSFVNVLGSLEDNGAVVRDGYFHLPGFRLIPEMGPVVLWIKLLHKLVVFVLLIFLVLIAPRRIRQLGDEAPFRYLSAVFVGLAAYILTLLIAVVLSPTIIGSIFVLIAFLAFKWLGIAGLFFALGRRLLRGVGIEPALLGGILLAFALYTAIVVVPAFFGAMGIFLSYFVFKPIFFLLFEAPAVGLVVITRAGALDAEEFETASTSVSQDDAKASGSI